MTIDRKIIHVDMDCFFAAVEMRDNPSIAHLPVAVGGTPDQRGVIATCNYAARTFGVRSAMATQTALSLCPNLVLVRGRMEVYREISQQIRSIFMEYTDQVEPLSLDEAYLDVSDCEQHEGSATWIAQAIREKIAITTGLTASAGVSSCKLIAKIASDVNKPNGICVIPPSKIPDFIRDLPLSKIPGVGPKTFGRLKDLGLQTCADAQKSSQGWLTEHFGKFGGALWDRCHGLDDRPVESTRVRKSVGAENTLSQDLQTRTQCLEQLHELIPKVTRRMEPHLSESAIHSVKVKLKFSDFELITAEQSADNFEIELLPVLLDRLLIRQAGRGVRLVGLAVGIRPKEEIPQLQLL